MNHQLAQHLLQIHLRLKRMGWANIVVALIFSLAIAGQWLWLPFKQTEQAALQKTLDKIQAALRAPADQKPAAPKPMAERNLIRFYDSLGEKSFVEQQVHTMFAIADQAGLSLKQGEYKLSFDKNGGFYTYQALLPMKGTYAQLRQFCEQTLLQIPFSSLDEISFKRDQIANRNLEARVKMSFYLSDADSVAEATVNAMVAEAMALKAAQDVPAPKRSSVVDANKPAGSDSVAEGEEDKQ